MCWLCEENITEAIDFIGDTSIRLGKDKHNRVAVLSKYRCHESITLYRPKFCPECGKDLIKANEDKIVVYGMCNKTFYAVYSHNNGNYYSIWYIDKAPIDMTTKGIENFMLENSNEGTSVAGTYQQIIDEFSDLIDTKE